jgi:ribonuclease HI
MTDSDAGATATLSLYSDGGCSGNPGPGGWAYVIVEGVSVREGSGGEKGTTNNRMELSALIQGLKALRADEDLRGRAVDVYTDSQYAQKGISEWIHSWKRNGWRTAAKESVKNKDLWVELDALREGMELRWHWVKGHAGNTWNERCDQLTQERIAELR